jgi:hypothetical protein
MRLRSLLLAVLLAASASPALAQKGGRHEGFIQPDWAFDRRGDNDRENRQQAGHSLREIVDMLRRRYGGDLISARPENGGRQLYVLRWRMPNGDIRDFTVDVESGQVF